MAWIKIDPVATMGAVGSSLLGRVILYFLAGLAGTSVGLFCGLFEEWGDFLRPLDLLARFEWDGNIFLVFFWWFFLVFSIGVGVLVAWPMIATSFFRMIFTEDPPWLHFLVLVFFAALGPVVHAWEPPSFLLFFFITIGFVVLGCYFAKRDFPERWEWLVEKFRFGIGKREFDLVHPDHQVSDGAKKGKIGLKGWGQEVELDGEEWDDS